MFMFFYCLISLIASTIFFRRNSDKSASDIEDSIIVRSECMQCSNCSVGGVGNDPIRLSISKKIYFFPEVLVTLPSFCCVIHIIFNK